ncbi:MAG: hypothetical protein CM15mP120_29150 [Pseudomonadota bacterium]|nr:MAG: hypothetical protein CM15mP120_29150 [Pseudomonadota bacterium]
MCTKTLALGWKRPLIRQLLDDLRARGHQIRVDKHVSTFGGAQLIQRLADGYVGGSDHRKEGWWRAISVS